ncbi:flavodoxin family protein [Nocardia higoensis]|uniref:flavodoxin family protein n=1 Tax=Nocardia higoensis TaxID=228599 RepID=UPI0002FA0EDC|nr:flavodoxin family protein [Nocardia higoensis]
MRARLVYESDLGKALAEAIADGLGARTIVRIFSTADAAELPEAAVDLVIVGGPAHAFGLARTACRRGATVLEHTEAPGIGAWLAQAAPAPLDARATAFGTKLATTRRLPGSTARTIGKRLRTLGYELAAEPADFLVVGNPTALLDGELRRAQAWGAHLAATAT